jgi:hypothetical protein
MGGSIDIVVGLSAVVMRKFKASTMKALAVKGRCRASGTWTFRPWN